MGAIDWGRLNQPDFDRVVEAFFMAENADLPQDAYAVNGRGGDGGIDIHVRRDGRLTIVQLKYFPEGFSGGWAGTRRGQIRSSFKSAVSHRPDEWWLVVPTTLTPRERRFVEGLPQRHTPKLIKPTVVVFDGPALDGLAAKHPGLVVYFKRDELRDAAKDYSQERALLVDKDDVLARVAALSKQADTLHPDWRLGLFTEGDIVGTTLVAKHSHAAERSPITLSLNATFGPDEEELRKSFVRAMSYGTPERIDLPGSVVSNFTVDGPEFVAHTSNNVAVSWWPANPDSVGRPVSLVFYGDRDVPVASFSGKTTWTGAAAVGASLRATFFDTVSLEFLLPFDKSNEVRITVGLEMAGRNPSDVVRAVSLLEQLESAHAVTIELDGAKLARLLTRERANFPFGENRADIIAHRDIAADLVVIQDATSRHFGYPAEVEFADVVYVRCLRLLLEGKCVVLPGQREFTPKLNGRDGEHIRQLLNENYMSLVIELENFGQELFGHNIYVGPARVYAPQVRAVDPEAALAALDARTAEGHEVIIRARDDYGFWMYLLDRYIDTPDDKLRPTSLGLAGFADAADVPRALEVAK